MSAWWGSRLSQAYSSACNAIDPGSCGGVAPSAATWRQLVYHPIPIGNSRSAAYAWGYWTGPPLIAAGAAGDEEADEGFAAEDEGLAAEAGGAGVNAAGRAYPSVTDLRTGNPIPAPPSGLTKVPMADRVPWGAQERGGYIKQWYDQGYQTPEGGWGQYDIHHITPREYGGTNDFWNLTPVLRSVHQTEFNPWWKGYGG
jgi:hypothetical protein